MKIRRNMAYRAPASQNYFGMRASELKEAAASGDAGAQAELDRRKANRDDPTTKAGQRQAKWDAAKAQKQESAPKSKVEKAAAEGKLNDRHHQAALSQGSDPTLQILQRAGQRQSNFDFATEKKLLEARRSLKTLQRAGRELYGNPDGHLARLQRMEERASKRGAGQPSYDQFNAEIKRRMAERKRYLEMGEDETLKTLQRAGRTRNNPLPYPGATVLYPHRGIVQGGTGPFYGPTGTLFDRTPDMLWEYNANPRMQGVEVLWPKTVQEAGAIQGGSPRYMEYPTAAPWDRMPNLTTVRNSKKRSR